MTAVPQSLRVLLIEDDPDDALLIMHELQRGGLVADLHRVETEAAFAIALKEHDWDAILADYRLPNFGALRALEIYRGLRLDIPFILVSGTLDDETAIACLRAGAHDYLLKDRMARLAPVVRREYNIRAERRRLEAQLRQAQKMEAIGTLAGGIAHDFNNILVGILGNVQLAQFESAQNPRALQRLDAAMKAAQRARDLVMQILTLSRQREQSPLVTPIGPVVEEALRLLRASLPPNIEFSLHLDPAAAPILCDPSQIHQIVMNLATNSAYAMRERGGRLAAIVAPERLEGALLSAHPQLPPGPGVCLTISDTGCGMDAATQQRLFEPFFTTKPLDEGTGLGLAVVHDIVKSHEGAITFESAPQRGTTFRIYFPAASAAAAITPPAAAATPSGHGEHLLVVDDEPSVTVIAELMLERLGYRVAAFSNPVVALATFREAPGSFQAVITDLAMPTMSGLDVTREILKLRPELPVLLMSGNLQVNDIARAKAAGVRAIIEKPFSYEQLAQRLEMTLTKKPKRR